MSQQHQPPAGFPIQLVGCPPELLTDLYQLTMAQSYFSHGMHEHATFELFTRRLPPDRNFLMAAGIEDALEFLEHLSFSDESVSYLRTLDLFRDDFLGHMRSLRFTGEVWAMPEGEVFFANEPILRVTAPIIEAQFVETFLLNVIGFQSLVASKAARVTIAAQGRPYADFSPRRDHGQDAALLAARASYIAGAASTSNVQAGQYYGIPVSGTMAHSYILSFPSEEDAFRAFLKDYPDGTTLLIDTHDTIKGAECAVEVMRELGGAVRVGAVRIDSGDILALSQAVRKILDDAGFPDVRIFASGDLDEWRIEEMVARGGQVDAYGVGTQLGTGGDVSSLGVVYKLVADDEGPKRKHSPGKATLPGVKQVFRFEDGGRPRQDILGHAHEQHDGARPVLEQRMAGGRRTRPRETLAASRERALGRIASLPPPLRSLRTAEAPYPAEVSAALQALLD